MNEVIVEAKLTLTYYNVYSNYEKDTTKKPVLQLHLVCMCYIF